MFQKRCLWSIGVLTLALSLAACKQAEEPKQKESVTKPAAPSGTAPETSQPAQKAAAPAPLQEFLQEISASAPLQTMQVGEQVTISVTVKNISQETWPATPDAEDRKHVVLGYRWRDKSGKVLTVGALPRLPHDLGPGQSMSLNLTIQAPPEAGDYILRLTMLQQGVSWFDDREGKPLDFPITVER